MVAAGVTGRTGLVVAVIGGPSQPEDVEPFLHEYFSDSKLFPPSLFSRPLAGLRAAKRARDNQAAYRDACSLVSLDSAMLRVCSAQANGIAERTGTEGYVAMRFGHPSPATAVELMLAEGMDSAIVVPGEPWPGMVENEGAVEAFVSAWSSRVGDAARVERVSPWHDDDAWLDVAAMTLRETLDIVRTPDRHVLFLGPACLDRGATVEDAFEAAASVVASRAEVGERWSSAWTPLLTDEPTRQPSAHDEVERLGEAGVRDLVIFSLGHVSDRLETLYPIDIGLARAAREYGMRTFRVPSLNDRDELLDALAGLVSGHVERVKGGGRP